MAVNFFPSVRVSKHLIKCWCGIYNNINSIKMWFNGQPVCECGQIIKNAPQEWKKNFEGE